MTVRVNFYDNWAGKILSDIDDGHFDLTLSIHRQAVQNAPKRSRNLVKFSKPTIPIRNGYMVKFGDSRTPYARIHELGGSTGRGYSVDIVAKHYLRDAGTNVMRGNIKKYFKIRSSAK